jgi:hypothetical protein
LYRDDGSLFGVELLELGVSAFEVVFELQGLGTLLGAECFRAVALFDQPFLEEQGFSGEALVPCLDRQLGASLPLVDLSVDLFDFRAQALFCGDGADDLLAAASDLLAHLLDEQIDGLLGVLRLVEQGVHVARDDLAEAIEDSHSRSSMPTCLDPRRV